MQIFQEKTDEENQLLERVKEINNFHSIFLIGIGKNPVTNKMATCVSALPDLEKITVKEISNMIFETARWLEQFFEIVQYLQSLSIPQRKAEIVEIYNQAREIKKGSPPPKIL